MVSFYWWSIEWSRKIGTKDLDLYKRSLQSNTRVDKTRSRQMKLWLVWCH